MLSTAKISRAEAVCQHPDVFAPDLKGTLRDEHIWELSFLPVCIITNDNKAQAPSISEHGPPVLKNFQQQL